MDKTLQSEVSHIITSGIATSSDCGRHVSSDEMADQIHAIYVWHNYGQKDEGAELPPLRHFDEEDARKGIASRELDIEMTARSDMRKDGWHKDKEKDGGI